MLMNIAVACRLEDRDILGSHWGMQILQTKTKATVQMYTYSYILYS